MERFVNIDQKANRIGFLDSRFYECHDAPGIFAPSVTTLLQAAPKSAHYYEWLKRYGKDADTMTAEAMEKGSKVHQATEDYDRGLEISCVGPEGQQLYTMEEWGMINKYVEFIDTSKPEVLLNESPFALNALGYAGTLDRIVRMYDQVWLIDLKTGGIYDHYFMQLAAYKTLAEHEHYNLPFKIDRVGILHLNAKTREADKSGKEIQGAGWKLETSDKPLEYWLKLFEHTRALWHFQNPNAKPNSKEFPLSIQKQVEVPKDRKEKLHEIVKNI